MILTNQVAIKHHYSFSNKYSFSSFQKITTYYNLYNFQSKAPNVLDYSVKTCYWNRDRRIFTFQIDGIDQILEICIHVSEIG